MRAADGAGLPAVLVDQTVDGVMEDALASAWARGAHVVEAGGEWHRLDTGLSFVISGDRNPNAVNGSSQQGGAGLPDSLRSIRDVTRTGVWLLDRWQTTPALAIEAGVRLDRTGVNRETQLSPRATMTVTLDARTRLRTGLGRYTQSPGYEKLVQSDYVLDLTGGDVGRSGANRRSTSRRSVRLLLQSAEGLFAESDAARRRSALISRAGRPERPVRRC